MDSIYIIAEAGVNHNGSLTLAKKLVEEAASCGADAIKFQTFTASHLVTRKAQKALYQKNASNDGDTQFEMLQSLELPHDDHYILLEHCQKHGIAFLSSSFHIEATAFLAEMLKLDTIKFGSGEITNAPLLWDAARRGLKILLSTGMSNLTEVYTALNFIAQGYDAPDEKPREIDDRSFLKSAALREKLTVFHCTSAYPTAFEDVHLNCLPALQRDLQVKIGFSDHTPGIEAPIAAAALGARMIEKHFTLDKTLPGPDQKASLDPQEFKSLVKAVRNIEKAMGGSEKSLRAIEENTALVARKQIVAKTPIRKGDLFNEDNITLKRSGQQGLSGFQYWDLIGKQALQDYDAEEIIRL